MALPARPRTLGSAMDAPLAMPKLVGEPDPDGWVTETLAYRVTARPKPKFHSVVSLAHALAGAPGRATVTTRTRAPERDARVLELEARIELGTASLVDQFSCVWRDGLCAGKLTRTAGNARRKEIDFLESPFPLPAATYPEVLLPFLLRGQPLDGARRALYAWTSDRFVARVYYESRAEHRLDVPAGRFDTTALWMYPDLNDWISLGSVVTRLAKPLLPRYEMWLETAAPHRLVRFEGAYGPPGAPEIVIELA